MSKFTYLSQRGWLNYQDWIIKVHFTLKLKIIQAAVRLINFTASNYPPQNAESTSTLSIYLK